MELLIAESGNTKTDWIHHGAGGNVRQWRGPGLNPGYMDDLALKEQVSISLESIAYGNSMVCHFYGAGVSHPVGRKRMERILQEHLPGIPVTVHTDLFGACRALCGSSPGSVAILGTGSNAARWNGEEIIAQSGGHGYLLGDEGGGADLGKTLLQKALCQELPHHLMDELEAWRGLSIREIRGEVYASAAPGRVMAGLSPFLGLHIHEPAIRELVSERFDLFISRSLLKVHPGTQAIHACGSIAWHFADLWKARLINNHLVPGTILQHPGIQLLEYHLRHPST